MNTALLAAGLAACLNQFVPANAAETVVMSCGGENMPSIAFTFDKKAQTPVIHVRTMMAGVAGSRIDIFVDRSKKAAFTHVFDVSECKFENGERSICKIDIRQGTPAYGAIVNIFRLGKEARITIADPGVMALDLSAPLTGFSKSFDM